MPDFQEPAGEGLVPNSDEAIEDLRQQRSPQRSQPPIKQPAICNGCRYLHGHIYGGTKLVCGVHPYGNGEDCSDFEAK